jgi:hypothetical protein
MKTKPYKSITILNNLANKFAITGANKFATTLKKTKK